MDDYTTLKVSRDLHTALKVLAAKQRRTLLEVTEEALREYLERQSEEQSSTN